MNFGAAGIVRDPSAEQAGVSFELRLYRLLCLATSVLLLGVVIPLNLFQHLSPWLNVIFGTFGLLSLVMYRLAARGVLLKRSYLFALVLVLNISWFTNGGSNGSISYFFFAVVVYAGIFFSGPERWTYLALFTVNGLALLVTDYLHPGWSVPFDAPHDRLLDLTTGFVVSLVSLTLMILLVRSGYDEERRRQLDLNARLTEALELNTRRTAELEALLAEVRTLRGLLPICSNCKSVRDDAGLWTQIERYVSRHTDASFTHSLCPDCMRKLYPEYADAVLDSLEPPPSSDDPAKK